MTGLRELTRSPQSLCRQVCPMAQPIPESIQQAFERTEHPFHMWEGLESTPEALATLFADSVQQQIARAAAALAEVDYIHFLGCGTSYFAGIAGAYAFHSLTGIPGAAQSAFEFAAYPPGRLDRSAVVAISHTGSTRAALDAVRTASDQGAVTIGLTDYAESPLVSAVTYPILGGGGREKSLPKTKSYPVSLLRQYLLAARVAERSGRSSRELVEALSRAPELARAVLADSLPLIKQLVADRQPASQIFLVGNGPNVATALEGCLKLQESAQVPAHAWQLEEAMHGPWSIINPGDWVILLAMRGPGLSKAQGLAAALQHIEVNLWVITDEPDGVPGAQYRTLLPAGVPEVFTPLYAILPLYQFTYLTALALGKRPDCMRLADPRYLRARLALPR